MMTVIEVFKSLVKLNGWEVERFDIQHYKYGENIEGYAGWVTIKDEKRQLVIHSNGSFEWAD